MATSPRRVLLATFAGMLALASCTDHGSRGAGPASTAPRPATSTVMADRCTAAPSAPESTAVDRFVMLDGHRIHAREWPGAGPTILLMHGFPDNLHLYDALVPELAGHHVVAFDFIGWGQSDKPTPATYPYTADEQIREVNAVVTSLRLAPVIAVVHDSSGPPGIDWAMQHQASVARLVLLNTYYNPMPTLRPPEAIAIFSAASLDKVQLLLAAYPDAGKELFFWQVGGFFENKAARAKYLPGLWAAFMPELPAFRALNLNLLKDVGGRLKKAPQLRTFAKPVTIAFGADDPYLNVGVANGFHTLFPGSRLLLIQKARHYVQFDQPRQVAGAILGTC